MKEWILSHKRLSAEILLLFLLFVVGWGQLNSSTPKTPLAAVTHNGGRIDSSTTTNDIKRSIKISGKGIRVSEETPVSSHGDPKRVIVVDSGSIAIDSDESTKFEVVHTTVLPPSKFTLLLGYRGSLGVQTSKGLISSGLCLSAIYSSPHGIVYGGTLGEDGLIAGVGNPDLYATLHIGISFR